ncbi:MAG: flagellar basal body L-ring protein FlgH [Planctomycetes bacterium]|nr:flagellar basal body L-ring protein FlgH [Planctomycetota bacterium]
MSLLSSVVYAESLWQAKTIADGTPYSDKLARHAGDLLTISVRESTSVSEQQKTSTSKETELGLEGTIAPVTATARSFPGVGLDSTRAFDGSGSITSNGSVRTTITARVTDVLDNGNLVIEGRRSLKINEDTKTILLTGIIRSADISADNTVASEKMHNFRVAIEGDGPMTKAQQRGIFSKLLGFLWPF